MTGRFRMLEIPPDWPIGTKVKMVECAEASLEKYRDRIWTTRSEPQILSGHTSVVWLEGYSGCFATEFLDVVE